MTPSRLLNRPLAMILALLLAGAAVAVVGRDPSPATAATTGAGYPGITPYGGYLGNYIAPDGTRVYCIDSSRHWPGGTTDAGTIVGSLTGSAGQTLTSTDLRKLNYALLTWGQTADPTNAAAVSAYIYAYTSNYANAHGAGYAAGLHYINGNAAVKAAYDVVWNESESRYAGSSQPSAAVAVELTGQDGAVTVSVVPSTARGTLSLDGAVVAGTTSASVAVSDGSIVPIRAVAGNTTTSVEVSARATFTINQGADASVVVYSTGDQQRTIRGAFPATTEVQASDEAAASLAFAPIVQTAVASRFVSPGATFSDGIVASVAAGSPEWRVLDDGSRVPITAVGTLYGPFAEQPAATAEPPAGAPVVGTETVVLTGPGSYSSPGTLAARSPGFYTWVWRIDAASQPENSAGHLPAGYHFADEFGLVAESHVVPLGITAVSHTSTAESAFGGEIGDELSVAITEGAWLREDGAPVPAVFDGAAYFVPGSTPPIESDTVPADAVLIGSAQIVATGPGIYSAPSTVVAPNAEGYVSWVWHLSPSSPSAPYFQPWSDRFGLPAETTRVAAPSVASLATAQVAIGDEVNDTALVGGQVPIGAYLVFEAYLQPADQSQPICTADTRVFESSGNPVMVSGPGSYSSPDTRFERYGTYYWIESLFAADGTEIHRGTCGLPEETTLVAPGEVVTEALAQVAPGESARDSAHVSGLVPRGATLVFEAYSQEGVTDGPLCTPATRVFTSDAVALDGPGTYFSESVVLDRPGTYYWVETLYDRNGNPLHVGTCGAANEVTQVTSDTLANTGSSILSSVVVVGALVALGGVALLVRRGIRARVTR